MIDSRSTGDPGPALIERATEVAVLSDLLAVVDQGAGRVAVVQGSPGIGKTAVVSALRHLAATSGTPLLEARGTELAMDRSFGAVGQIFAGQPGRPAILDPLRPDDARTGDFALLKELFDVTVRIAGGRPLVLVVDDCHWLDVPSLRYLAYLAAKIAELPVLLVLATRPDAGPLRQPVVDEILSGPNVALLRPPTLSRAASERMLTMLLGRRPDAAFTAVCFRETVGNPLFLGELAAAVLAAGMEPVAANAVRVARIGGNAVKHRVLQQLATLRPSERRVLDAVAVLGDGVRGAQLAELTEIPDLDQILTVLLGTGLVLGSLATGVEFAHPLLRSGVYENIDVDLRADLHQRAAGLLVRADAGVETVAAHYVAGPGPAPASESPAEPAPGAQPGSTVPAAAFEASPAGVLTRAAAEAVRRGSPESALRYLRRGLALDVPEDRRQEMLLAAAQVAFQVDLPSAVDYLTQTLRTMSEPIPRIELTGTLVAALLLTGRIDETLAAIRREQAALPDPRPGGDDPYADSRTSLDSWIAMVAVNNPALPGLTAKLHDLLRRPPVEGFGGRSLDGVLALYQTSRAEPEAVDRALRAIVGGVRMTGEPGRGPVPIAVNVLLLADRPEGLAHLDRAVERSRDEGSLLASSGAYAYRAQARLLQGDLPGAYDDARTARWSTAILGLRNKSFIASVMANICIDTGRLDQAADTLAWSEVLDAPVGRPFTFFAVVVAARLHRIRGEFADALRLALEAGERFTAGGGVNPAQVPWQSEAALAAHRLGDRSAVRHAEAELHLARQWGAPRTLGRALRVLAEVGERPELLDEAVDILRPSIARLELARCLVARGAVRGMKDDVEQALSLSRACGAGPLEQRARDLLSTLPA
ncbi:AAA ATPase domain-containing protein [Nakamurella panacisegetis]|uniref:AAA ATPase domain-containing protein n=1 Tax=Nakamurella panacisegetis TaxID=1090615 RepID=A0A1H0KIC5_9ACTN|nr:AAA family ATPase [Nakamurella panacisegetis]SDO55734.1 AAA ATPase domain-containing protein [Nakamurella panacisegetis]